MSKFDKKITDPILDFFSPQIIYNIIYYIIYYLVRRVDVSGGVF